MKNILMASISSAVIAMASLPAAASPRHTHLMQLSEQARNAKASLPSPAANPNDGLARGNAGAAPAGR